ncbi:MAG: carotenoid oxygenase family protein [Deltaproteobacteria bacterium]|nr:carotenoid oxygenase family protein [Deltaproteobacteria bacterium]
MGKVVNREGNEYLRGNFSPIDDEIEVRELAVTGAIPSALTGLYLRNGPNPMFEPLGSYHWFDGDGMLHGIRLEGGKASYRNRWIQSRGLAAEKRAGRAVYGGMKTMSLTDPALVGESGPLKNTANTNVIRHAGRILCLMEGAVPTEVKPDLGTVGEHDFAGRLQTPFTAHPKLDPETGEMLAFGYIPTLKYLRVSPTGELLQSEDIGVGKPTMMHDFTCTTGHAIFMDAPALLDFESFFAGGPMVKWDPSYGTRIGVMPRTGRGSDIRWFEIDVGYVVHFMNAWEEGRKIMVDGFRFREMDFGTSDGKIPDPDGFLTRFTIDLDAGSVKLERIGELPGEFPRVRPEVEGRKHRYSVAATFVKGPPSGPRFDSVTLYDSTSGKQSTHAFRDGEITGEPVFAPDPSGTAENDGWILTMVSDAEGAHTDLVILDGHDLSETARVHMPRRVPFGFHGNWLPDGSEALTTPRR